MYWNLNLLLPLPIPSRSHKESGITPPPLFGTKNTIYFLTCLLLQINLGIPTVCFLLLKKNISISFILLTVSLCPFVNLQNTFLYVKMLWKWYNKYKYFWKTMFQNCLRHKIVYGRREIKLLWLVRRKSTVMFVVGPNLLKSSPRKTFYTQMGVNVYF